MKQLKLHSMRSLRPARLIQCLIVATLLGHDLNCQGQNNSILLPRPQQINYTDDSLKLTDSPDIYPGNYYERWINKTADTLRSPYRIHLSQHLPQIPLNQEEAYRIEITRQHIFVEAVTTEGRKPGVSYLPNHRLAGIPHPGIHAGCRPDLHVHRRIRARNRVAEPVQNKCFPLAPHREPGLEIRKQTIPGFKRRQKHDKNAGEILYFARSQKTG